MLPEDKLSKLSLTLSKGTSDLVLIVRMSSMEEEENAKEREELMVGHECDS